MQRVAAARAGVVIDIDHHSFMRECAAQLILSSGDAWQIDLPARPDWPHQSWLITGRSLLDISSSPSNISSSAGLGATPEAMALQFFDDLKEPFVELLRNQHRFERAGIEPEVHLSQRSWRD